MRGSLWTALYHSAHLTDRNLAYSFEGQRSSVVNSAGKTECTVNSPCTVMRAYAIAEGRVCPERSSREEEGEGSRANEEAAPSSL